MGAPEHDSKLTKRKGTTSAAHDYGGYKTSNLKTLIMTAWHRTERDDTNLLPASMTQSTAMDKNGSQTEPTPQD